MGFFDWVPFIGTTKKAELIANKIKLPLVKERISIGRDKNADKEKEKIFFGEDGNLKIRQIRRISAISRKQAELNWDKEKGRYKFKDVSSFGSRVNRNYIHRQEVLLEKKNTIILGENEIKFVILHSR